jgi:hypothetical protein
MCDWRRANSRFSKYGFIAIDEVPAPARLARDLR